MLSKSAIRILYVEDSQSDAELFRELSGLNGELTVVERIVLHLRASFYGKENPNLFAELKAELPGILHWAIEGWRKLQTEGKLIQPASGKQLLDEMNDLASPIGAFVRQCCIVDPAAYVPRADLFDAYRAWCEQEGRKYTADAAGFGRDLRASVPDLEDKRPKYGATRVRCYMGVMLNDDGAKLIADTSAAGF